MMPSDIFYHLTDTAVLRRQLPPPIHLLRGLPTVSIQPYHAHGGSRPNAAALTACRCGGAGTPGRACFTEQRPPAPSLGGHPSPVTAGPRTFSHNPPPI